MTSSCSTQFPVDSWVSWWSVVEWGYGLSSGWSSHSCRGSTDKWRAFGSRRPQAAYEGWRQQIVFNEASASADVYENDTNAQQQKHSSSSTNKLQPRPRSAASVPPLTPTHTLTVWTPECSVWKYQISFQFSLYKINRNHFCIRNGFTIWEKVNKRT